MSVRFIPGTFRQIGTPNFLFVIADDYSFPSGHAYESVHTPGATITSILEPSPGLHEQWDILSISFQAYLFFQQTKPVYGKLGKLLGGLLIDAPSISQPPFPSDPPAFQQAPTDTSMFTTLWDGTADPLPPVSADVPAPTDFTRLLFVSGSFSPPISKGIYPGQKIGLGLWLTPSLLGPSTNNGFDAGLVITQANYSLSFDDGF